LKATRDGTHDPHVWNKILNCCFYVDRGFVLWYHLVEELCAYVVSVSFAITGLENVLQWPGNERRKQCKYRKKYGYGCVQL